MAREQEYDCIYNSDDVIVLDNFGDMFSRRLMKSLDEFIFKEINSSQFPSLDYRGKNMYYQIERFHRTNQPYFTCINNSKDDISLWIAVTPAEVIIIKTDIELSNTSLDFIDLIWASEFKRIDVQRIELGFSEHLHEQMINCRSNKEFVQNVENFIELMRL